MLHVAQAVIARIEVACSGPCIEKIRSVLPLQPSTVRLGENDRGGAGSAAIAAIHADRQQPFCRWRGS